MMPLCTTANLPAASRCGWALRSVGRPWVAHRVWPMPGAADERRRIGLRERLLEVRQPARAPAHRHSTVAVQNRETRRVVTAVFHPAERVDHDVTGGAVPDVADDSTHG